MLSSRGQPTASAPAKATSAEATTLARACARRAQIARGRDISAREGALGMRARRTTRARYYLRRAEKLLWRGLWRRLRWPAKVRLSRGAQTCLAQRSPPRATSACPAPRRKHALRGADPAGRASDALAKELASRISKCAKRKGNGGCSRRQRRWAPEASKAARADKRRSEPERRGLDSRPKP